MRAIAVIAVLIFHFSREKLPGGFAGVDVFFVISGYLMTSIIFRGVSSHTFSLLTFFKNRATRIIPALLVVVIGCLALGYFSLEPASYKTLGQHAVASLLFFSNVIYRNESGYFDMDAYSKLLLHTWSLSVEWQFYIAFPLVLVLLGRVFGIAALRKVVLFIGALSFCCTLYFLKNDPTTAYYLFYSRSWEMLVGGVAFLYPLRLQPRYQIALELLGLFLIFASFFVISQHTSWPGYMALLPVGGAYLCILADNKKTILGSRFIRKIGLLSYSLYLVHWPVIVYARKLDVRLSFIWYIAITVVASSLIYVLVEKRRRYHYGLIVVFLLTVLCAQVIAHNGFAFRVDKEYRLSAREYHLAYYGGGSITSSGTIELFNAKDNTPELIIAGDSTSRQYAKYIEEHGISAAAVFKDGCRSFENYYESSDTLYSQYCNQAYRNLMQVAREYPETPVVYSILWGGYRTLDSRKNGEHIQDENMTVMFAELDEMVQALGKNRRVYMIGTLQGSSEISYECLGKYQLPVPAMLGSACQAEQPRNRIEVNERLRDWAKKHVNVMVIDANDFLCSNGQCRVLTEQGKPVYSDTGHLSIYGAEMVFPHVMELIRTNDRIH